MTVYRRDDFAFPPARGRRGVEFHADGTFTGWLIGRGDAPEAAGAGRWSAGGQISSGSGPTASIVSVAADRLEIRWEG
ncbi:hypothetical protein [Kribbella sp. NPDC023855]|uniref:hypothetical protein n=1 Tax=Kribbella sp. NPDC023855 TaxID=3154698 RepID=UPI00340EFCAA